MTASSAVGIDLGTTHSVVACVNNAGHTEIVPDLEGRLLVPSIVLFDDSRTIVGEEARLRAKAHPERFAACAKLDMGASCYSQTIGDRQIPPEVIQACILNRLKQHIQRGVAPGYGVVIAVPAHFNDVQRRATVEAGAMAGLPVLDVLNEPMAAALGYGEQTGYLLPDAPAGHPQRLLVYDLGGFTFEATLLELDGGNVKTIATEYDAHLGGHDWDMQLVDYLAEQAIEQGKEDPRRDPSRLDNVLHRAAVAKIALGIRSATTVTLSSGNETYSVRLTRDDMSRLTTDLLERTAAVTERLLNRVGISWPDVPSVLLVGGATQMPAVRALIKTRTGRDPLQTVNAAEVVARGAAIYAAHLIGNAATTGRQRQFQITNVSTHSLGVEGVDTKHGTKVNKILIPRGTPLPVTVKRDFVTKASAQQTIAIVVLEGEHPNPEKCTTVGRAVLRDLPGDLTAQWPVEVTYTYAANGRLSVDVRVRYTERAVHLELQRSGGISQENLARWKNVIGQESGFAAFQQVLDHAERSRLSQPIALPMGSLVSPKEPEVGILSFLKRYMPFAFNRGTRDTAAREHDDRG